MWLINAMSAWRVRHHIRSLTVGGRKRTYYTHVPASYDAANPTPLILALHGATMNGPLMAWFTGLNAKADQAGFIAVYPDGTGTRSGYFWNAGNCCGSAVENSVDDVGFIRMLLDELETHYRVDTRRVFVTGMSNGAMMAYRLASELSERIAAIAPVAGTMGSEECHPRRPVSVMHFHGTEDEFVPFNGGVGRRSISGAEHFSVEHSIRAWVKANGCNDEPVVDELADNVHDDTKVIRRTYSGGRDASEVILFVIEGGGHTWPGSPPRSRELGRSTRSVSANDLIWDFFDRHPFAGNP